jgi:hydroxyacylglutathione hydrolase
VLIHNLDMGLSRAYLLESQAGLYLVDAGMPGLHEKVFRYMRSLGRRDLRLIFITHAHLDHYGSAAALRRLTGAKLAIHLADAKAMSHGETPLGDVRGRGQIVKYFLPLLRPFLKLEPVQPDLTPTDGDVFESFDLNASLLHLPGHTPGSSALLVEEKHAFVGDLLSTSGIPHLQRYYASDWRQIPDSLVSLQAHHPLWVYPGHGSHPLPGADLNTLLVDRRNKYY